MAKAGPPKMYAGRGKTNGRVAEPQSCLECDYEGRIWGGGYFFRFQTLPVWAVHVENGKTIRMAIWPIYLYIIS
jgi:hypothetical protein